MEAKPYLSVIVPIYNEEGNIDELCQRIHEALDAAFEYEVILVNDGSTDGSREKLDKIAAEDPRCTAVHFARNFGQTAALMAGFDLSRGQVIVPLDGDLQNDPADIPLLVGKVEEGFDVCSGWRRDRKDNKLLRLLPSLVANRLISMISGVKLNDYGCTLKAYRREVIKDVRLYGEMHRFVPIYATWQGAKVTELPVRHHARTRGASKYGLNRTFKVVLDLLVVKFLADYSQRPIHLFGGLGILNILLSLAAFGLMIYYKFWGGKTFIETPLPQLTIMLFLMGFMFILMGLLAELNVRIYYESQQKPTYKVDKIVGREED